MSAPLPPDAPRRAAPDPANPPPAAPGLSARRARAAPPPRQPVDMAGAAILLSLSLIFASNNLLIKYGTEAFQPVVMAALRSGIAALALTGWMLWRGIEFRLDLWRPGLLIGAAFGIEFFLLFMALDLTTVVRAAILFYAMPLWTALLGHFLFAGERLNAVRLAGFGLGFSAVVVTVAAQAAGGSGALGEAGGSLAGDLLALSGGVFWALIVVVVRLTRLSGTQPETQLAWQLWISAPLLLLLAPIYGGEWFRAVDGWQVANVVTQALVVALGCFLAWFHMLRRYPAGAVASFGFVTPVLSVLLGWVVLGEPLSASTPVALVLLVAGLWLINRR